MTKSILDVKGLSKSFGGKARTARKLAVDDVSFTLSAGETIGLVGESGSGKSTTANCILGLTRPDGGEILFKGRDLALASQRELRESRQHLQMVFQDPYDSLDPRMSVRELIGESLRPLSLTRERRNRRIEELAASVALRPGVLNRRPAGLSGGERQRVGIARALAPQPSVIVLDEPTSSLDLSVRAGIIRLLKDIQQQTKIAYIFISHDLMTVGHISSRLLVMFKGRIVETGPTAEIMSHSAHPYTIMLLSSMLTLHGARTSHKLGGPVDQSYNGRESQEACDYSERCPLAEARCRNERPGDHLVASERLSKCFRFEAAKALARDSVVQATDEGVRVRNSAEIARGLK